MRHAIRILVGLLAFTGLTLPQPAAAAGFAPGNLVVVRVGTGAAALSSAAAPVFLDEYTPAGVLVQSVALPTASASGQRRLTMSGSATSEGALSLSADGRYLALTGYDADPGTASVAGTPTSTVPRVVGRVDGSGNVDSSTAVTDIFSGANIRGATTDDGSRFWVAGASGGVRLSALGSTGSTTQINSAAPTNLRTVSIAAGQLYFSTGSTPTGVYAVGNGLPTTGGQTPALVTGSASPYAFVLLDRDATVSGVDTLYIADDSAGGGVLKFSFDGATWTARGATRPGSGSVRGLTGSVSASSVTLFATTTTSQLVRVEDTAAFDAPIAATSTTIATAAANTALRGVAFSPAGTGGPTAPSIVDQPQDATVAPGGTATLSVTATNAEAYQWFSGETPIEGATSATFTTPALTESTSYWVRVSNAAGSVDSRVATVTVGACTRPPVTIGSVQGSGETSPVVGNSVSIRGTVVGDYEGASPALRGYYVQDAGDGNASTSDGIFVFDGGSNLVSLGDVVQVTGTVTEFQGQTQLTGAVELCGEQGTITPTDVTLPLSTPDALERYEGMLVRMHQTLFVTEHFQLGRFGQVVVSSGDRLRQPTADIRATDQAAVAAAQAANNRNRLIIDDALNNQNADPILFGRGGQPLSANNTLRGGDTVTDPVGVMTYTWAGNSASPNAYRLRPIGAMGGAADFQAGNPRPDTPPSVGDGQIKVASANLLNFFNTFTGCREDCRGAENETEYQRQLAKEVASLRFLDADVIGYMEMENDGYGSASAVQALVNALNAADGPGAWAFVDPDAATGIVDSAGLDAIKAGIIYRTARVTAVVGATFANQHSVFQRRPIGQTFQTADGAKFTVISNHFKSKGSCPDSGPDADQGDGQGCWNAQRTEQAQELARWIGETVIPTAGDADVLIVGDLNSYAGEDPIAALEAAGYVNLVKRFHGNEAYSYAFDGQWGYLDYVMASASLNPQVTGAADAHHNADEPAILDYNTNFKSPGQIISLYAPDRFRTSDHDPVLAGLNLGVPASIGGSAPAGRVGDAYSYRFTTSGTAPVTVTVHSGSLPPGLALAADGTLSGTPSQAGEFAFTVRAANQFGSSTLDVTVTIAKAATTTVLTSSANPATIGGAITFTATVNAVGGTVQFTVDGAPLGSPVAVTDGKAVSAPATLTMGAHQVTAAYSGNDSYLPSDAALTQLVRYGVKVVKPASGASYRAGAFVPVTFQLVDATGKPIPHFDAILLMFSGRVTVSASGAQSLSPTPVLYDPLTQTFVTTWHTKPKPAGAVTISISITYDAAPTQQVTIPITLT